jgi:chromosome segregation protein
VHLKRLRVRGFKSFPKQTELVFEPGVAVIIGPNGSGKSNLADAVVWALGEQSPTTVRGSSMQDVIFAGSDGRRASATAEVELVFDNAGGALPLPTDEVSVMRRVGRDGGSQYLINHSTCRLTDVVELMAGVGLGRELHSIIGQGRVEAFLAGKPEDRRNQIEEAAGLGAFKRRRERAELKLREVRRNVERAELMEREVGGQLTPLRRQANAAEQMRAVETELAGVRGRLLSGELATVDAALEERREALAAVDAERAACHKGLTDLAARRAGEEERFARRLAERERRAGRLLRARVLDGRLESVERLTTQRLRLLDEVERSSAAERERLVAELAGRPEAEAPGDAGAEARLVAELSAAEEAHAAVTGALEGARAALAERRAEAARTAVERENALAVSARLERRLHALSGERERLERQLAALEGEAEKKAAQKGSTAALEGGARAKLTEVGTRAAAAANEAAACETALDAAAERRHAASGELAAAEAELQHLEASLRDLEDVAGDVLEVATGFPGTVALTGALSCEAGYERALAAALSQASGALAVPADVDHWSLLGAFKKAGIGLVRLIVPPRRSHAPTAFPGAAPLLDKIAVGERDELAAALADVVIVDDLRAVPDGFPGLAVTRDGEFYRPSAGQLGLAGGLPAALLLERRAALEGLRERLDSLRAREARESAAWTKAREARENAVAASRAVEQEERAARIAAEEAGRELAELTSRLRDLEDTLARARRSSEALAAEAAEALAGKEAADASAAAALIATEQLKPALTASEAAVAGAESEFAASLGTVTRCRVELEERRAALARAAEEQRLARERAAEARTRLMALEARLAALPTVRDACAALTERLAALRERAAALLAGLEGDAGEEGPPERGELQALANREAELRHALDMTSERRSEAQVAIARLEDRRGELATQLDAVAETLEQASFAPPETDDEAVALRQELERVERRRDRIGPVNPLAEAECAELGERAAFLREQRRDLERSVEDLEALIVELTTEVDAEFAETFTAVQEQFAHMVEVLFPGGRGRLLLQEPGAENEPGGVSVEVKPARKLGKKLQLLSGGERALVAIAFLMALVLARPCPFYILDEIEAALDDVNIGRLVQLLRDYRERTQFIIITHQKRTMEAADVLYGVTMGPDGGSAVVSARMAEEEIEREERAKKTKD